MVHILQVLCPSRHCLFAIAYEEDKQSHESAKEQAHMVFDEGLINPWCGICGSKVLRLEIGRTKWKTMEQAAPHLAEAEAAQLATRAQMERERN